MRVPLYKNLELELCDSFRYVSNYNIQTGSFYEIKI